MTVYCPCCGEALIVDLTIHTLERYSEDHLRLVLQPCGITHTCCPSPQDQTP